MRNERGATLIATIILLFFISHFLLSVQLWHYSIYMNYSSLEVYYEKKVLQYLTNSIEKQEIQIQAPDLNETVESPLDRDEE